jgi:hypothetical protein
MVKPSKEFLPEMHWLPGIIKYNGTERMTPAYPLQEECTSIRFITRKK